MAGGQVASVMTAYNRVNGHYAAESPLLREVVREEWRFRGFFVSDWWGNHRYDQRGWRVCVYVYVCVCVLCVREREIVRVFVFSCFHACACACVCVRTAMCVRACVRASACVAHMFDGTDS